MKKHKAILFDLDNTLINTHIVLKKYLEKIILKYYKITPKEEHVLETETIEQVMEWMKKHKIKIKSYTKILSLLHFIFTDIKKIKTLPNATKLLEKYQNKAKLGIITNGPCIYANKILKQNKLKKYFQTIQTTTRNKPKPNPEMIHKAAKKLYVKTEECIVVDDGVAGIEAGKIAGCTTIYIGLKKDIKSDYYANNLEEVGKILEKII